MTRNFKFTINGDVNLGTSLKAAGFPYGDLYTFELINDNATTVYINYMNDTTTVPGTPTNGIAVGQSAPSIQWADESYNSNSQNLIQPNLIRLYAASSTDVVILVSGSGV